MHRLFVQCCYDITYMYGEGNMTEELYLAIVLYNCAFSGCYQVLIAASRLCPEGQVNKSYMSCFFFESQTSHSS